MADKPLLQFLDGTVAHAGVLSELHGLCFEEVWTPESMAALLVTKGTFARIAVGEDDPDRPAGFVVCRLADVECEIITIGIVPARRRRGSGALLLEEALRWAGSQGATTVFLEVAEDNEGAIALYRSAGFIEFGVRRDYYKRDAGRVNAVMFRRLLEHS